MSHIVAKSAYKSLEERLNRFPQGAAPTDTLYKILEALFSRQDAHLVSMLPIKPFTPKTAAKIWGVTYTEAVKTLETLASRCILFDMEVDGDMKYALPPPMVGFFEFALMRIRTDIDQKLLSGLFQQYLNVEEDFIKHLLDSTDTRFGRAMVNESILTTEQSTYVLDYERATSIIESATNIGVSMCYCRHKKHHLGKDCYVKEDLCMTFNTSADFLIRHEHARKIEKSESLEILHKAYEYNLVQFAENARNDVSFICNCCSCCCDALNAAKRFGNLHPIETSNYLPNINTENCNGCKKCKRVCPIDAIDDNLNIDKAICLGCGVCVRACPTQTMYLTNRPKSIITPVNSVHRTVLMAIDKGMLQELLFDNKALHHHRALAAILSAILKLPPIKKAMASKQMKSVYLDKLLSKSTI